MQKKYRKNVAIFVLNTDGQILVCERNDANGAWQLPQGGIDPEESPEQAMKRELLEEIGTNNVTLIDSLTNPIRYDWPEHLYSRGYHGQEQYYFLVRIEDVTSISLDSHEKPEFQQIRWVGAQEFLKIEAGFKKSAYEQALTQFIKKHRTLISV